MCRTLRNTHLCPPTYPAGARSPQIPSCVARTFHLLVGLVSFPSLSLGHVRTNPCPYPPPSHPPLSPQPWGQCHIGFPLPVWAVRPFLERLGPGQQRSGGSASPQAWGPSAQGSRAVCPQERVSQTLLRPLSPSPPHLSKSGPSLPARDSTLRVILPGLGLEECTFLRPYSSCSRVQRK